MSQTSFLAPMLITRTRLKDAEPRRRRSYYEEDAQNAHLSKPSIFIYRNAKYIGFFHRMTQYVVIYSRVYILQPLLYYLSQAQIYLLEFLGFLILLFLSPGLIILAIVLYVATKLKTLLVSRLLPCASSSENTFSSPVLKDATQEMVNCIVWTNGKVDIEHIRARFNVSKVPILKNRIRTKYGLQIWEPQPDFNIRDRIVESPPKFQLCSINDQDGFHGQKSALQKYITYCISKSMDFRTEAPWKIISIPQPSVTKDRTCCLIQFHSALLQCHDVRKLLDDIFNEPVDSDTVIQHNLEDRFKQFLKSKDLDEPLRIVEEFGQNIFRNCDEWVKTNMWRSFQDIRTWYTLRRKQWKFHGKRTLLKAVGINTLQKFQDVYTKITNLHKTEFCNDLKILVRVVSLILRALSFIPIQIISCLIRRDRSGFQKVEKEGTRHVAWSKTISKDLIEAIRERTDEAEFESILLTAVSMTLREYYVDNGIRNTKFLNVSVPNTKPDLLDTLSFKSARISTEAFNTSEQVKKLDSELEEYPVWRLVGTHFTMKYLAYCLPRSWANLVFQQLVKVYPITFNYVDTDGSVLPSIIPTMSLWGHPVEEFTFWKSSLADFSVSITVVKYFDSLRLTVVSPMKSVDLILSKRFPHYLNRLAEAVGVGKGRIPYSRKTSPASSSCTSPYTLLSQESKLVMQY